MARDIAITTDRETEYNERGDLRNATGEVFVYLRVFIAVNELVDMSPPSLNDTDIEEQRSNIEAVVRQSQFTEEPISVSVQDVDYDNQIVTYSITTNKISETIDTT